MAAMRAVRRAERRAGRERAGGGTKRSIERAAPRRWRAGLVGIGLAVALCAGVAPAQAEEYRSDEAGHPLRILAYVVHPIGVTYDYLILRPAFWIGSHDPFKTLFGRTD